MLFRQLQNSVLKRNNKMLTNDAGSAARLEVAATRRTFAVRAAHKQSLSIRNQCGEFSLK